jgi:hypothetical protein
MSSEEEFFDILYLGIFVILSPAFDSRFYLSIKPPTTLIDEIACAVHHFHSLLHVFSLRFLIILDGEAVSHFYVVDRMLAEFAAAAVVFAKATQEGIDDGEVGDGISSSMFAEHIEGILQASHPSISHYYSRCLDRSHKHFIWTGPQVQILPRSEEFISIISLTTRGELLDLPAYGIYADLDPTPPIAVGKRHVRGESMDLGEDKPKKRQR